MVSTQKKRNSLRSKKAWVTMKRQNATKATYAPQYQALRKEALEYEQSVRNEANEQGVEITIPKWADDPGETPERPQPRGERQNGFRRHSPAHDLFLPDDSIASLMELLRRKKNLVLQGPPGTGKTYVARQLAEQLTGAASKDRIEVVQFHQSYGYEDFVRGFRPTAEGTFVLQDGPFLRFCERARTARDQPHVLIVDEINRGNLSRIFGELLMLLEADKRSPKWAVRLAYGRPNETAYSVPANVHLIGAMNTADRALALVDYALRRRFIFATIGPAFGRPEFIQHLADGGVPDAMRRRIRMRLEALNERIRQHPQLGEGFQVGHSYFCRPELSASDGDWDHWYENIVHYEITPLLNEYWFDDAEIAETAVRELLSSD